jgi:hypothetical protein
VCTPLKRPWLAADVVWAAAECELHTENVKPLLYSPGQWPRPQGGAG